MAVLLILALLASGIPAARISVPCPRCCDGPHAAATLPDAPPCCRLSPETLPIVARSAPAGAIAARPPAADHFITLAWPPSRMLLTSRVMSPLHPAPLILRI